MTDRVRAAGATVVLTAIVSACSVAPNATGLASPSPALSPAPTPTLNPNQLEALRRSLGASPTPRPATARPTTSGVPGSAAPTPSPSPYDAALQAMLPASIRAVPLQRFSVPASAFAGGGDLCIVLCSDEPGRLAAASGLTVDDLTVGIAIAAETSGLATGILAIRFKGIDSARLVGIRLRAGGHSSSGSGIPPTTQTLRIGSKQVVWVTWPPFYSPGQAEYLLGGGDVLFIVQGLPPSPTGAAPADVVLAVEALP